MLLFLLKKEFRSYVELIKYSILFYLCFLVFLQTEVFIFYADITNNKSILIKLVFYAIYLLSANSAPYFLFINKNNGSLELFFLSKINLELLIFIKLIVYWLFILFPIAFIGVFSILFLQSSLMNFHILYIFYVFTFVVAINNYSSILLTFNSKRTEILSFTFSLLINIPVLLVALHFINLSNINDINYILIYVLLSIVSISITILVYIIHIIFYGQIK